jgi:peptide chain release factor 2
MADPKAENALRDAVTTLEELESRWNAAREYLKIDESRLRHKELSVEAADPHLWDDQDRAREVTTELGRLTNDLEAFDELRHSLDDGVVLADFSRETLASGEVDWSLLDELSQTVATLEHSLEALEMLSLLSGPYDQNDAIAELHAGAGGTDAQDWTEMLLRMYSRWAERRGFGVEVDEVTQGQEAGLLSATFIVKGRYAYGWLSTERGVHRLVRMSPFDSQARRQTSFASIDITPLLD